MRAKHAISSRFGALIVAGLGLMAGIGAARAQTEDGYHRLPKRLIGDYGYWSRTQNPPYSSAQIPFDELTEINHAGVSFNASGALVVPPELIEKAHAAGDKVLLRDLRVRDGTTGSSGTIR